MEIEISLLTSFQKSVQQQNRLLLRVFKEMLEKKYVKTNLRNVIYATTDKAKAL